SSRRRHTRSKRDWSSDVCSSDLRYGRRAPVLVGVSVHVIASLLCLWAPSVAPLIVLRIIQGIGNASAAVVAVAVIRDRLIGAERSEERRVGRARRYVGRGECNRR